jgi:copper(I)-binding protein
MALMRPAVNARYNCARRYRVASVQVAPMSDAVWSSRNGARSGAFPALPGAAPTAALAKPKWPPDPRKTPDGCRGHAGSFSTSKCEKKPSSMGISFEAIFILGHSRCCLVVKAAYVFSPPARSGVMTTIASKYCRSLGAAVAVLIGQLWAAQVQAADYDVGPIHISQPWARATPKGAKSGAGHMTITNNGTTSSAHLMFLDLKHPLEQANTIAATLQFEKAGTAQVEFPIAAIGASAPPRCCGPGSTDDARRRHDADETLRHGGHQRGPGGPPAVCTRNQTCMGAGSD